MLRWLVDKFLYDFIGLSPEGIGGVVNFFIYDSIKVIFLLYIMISVIGFLRTFISQKKIRKLITGKNQLLGHFGIALFGAMTPFCSCSGIPIFLGFVKAGIPIGVTLTFLVTSPILNEYLFVLMFSMFGAKIAFAYAFTGITIGIVSGFIMGKMGVEKYLEKDFAISSENNTEESVSGLKNRFEFGLKEANEIVAKLWKWILIGVALGALIHNYVPESTIQNIAGKGGAFSVILAVLLGVPMYGSCAAIVPIAVVLFQKGLPLGTALAFMMAISALSLPEAVILRRAMHIRLIAMYFSIVTIGIIFIGYFFNMLSPFLIN